MLPAAIANMSPVFLKGKTPLDFGKCFKDGSRILGDGKTIEGTLGGTLIGGLAGLIQLTIIHFLGLGSSMWGFGPPGVSILIVFTIAFGALFGDLLGSFLKRRLKFKRGAKFPVMDQYDLVIGVMILLFLFPYSRPWALDQLIFDWHWISLLTIIVFTYLIHRISNIIGYLIGVKKVPW